MIVPVSIPGIVATAVYTFLLAWNEFLFALTLTKSMDLRTVPIGIQLLMGQHAFEWNEMMAMSVLARCRCWCSTSSRSAISSPA